MASYLVTGPNGSPVAVGDTVEDSRGNTALFHSVERGPAPGKSAKVIVDVNDGHHSPSLRTYYAGVFDLVVTPIND